MSAPSPDPRFLELFPAWLGSLGSDAAELSAVASGDAPIEVRRYVVAALNYVFKSIDLIPDGIDDLGFMDDAFVMRVAAAMAKAEGGAVSSPGAELLARLAGDAADIRAFLEDDFRRLESYVRGLRDSAARGRTVEEITVDPVVCRLFVGEVKAWSQAFEVPSFTRDPKTLIRLKAFLAAKLPA
jgi:uncharacterized membrane protein YkvA (DUF1232 family)